MTHRRSFSMVAMMLAGGLLAGCSDAAASPGAEPGLCSPARSDVRTYSFRGDEAQSRVERAVREDGGETLRGETRPAADPRAVIREHVELDPGGRLLYADILVDDGVGRVRRMILDRARGAAYLLGEGSGTLRVPADAPWVYAPPALGARDGAPATPIAAWVALRAASTGAAVRVIDGAASHSVASDQVVVRDGDEAFVVIGDAAIPAAGDFVGWQPPAALAAAPRMCRPPQHC